MRSEKVKQMAQQIIKDGNKPSARVISDQLGFSEPDVHRCLNSLEKKRRSQDIHKKRFLARNIG